jgi:hypothetical protein
LLYDHKGEVSKLTLDVVLIVTRYNTEVSALRDSLPQGAHVGTVDKFQRHEAPVIFCSIATSTAADAPRGMEFLYSSNRLNVAISRARSIAVLVASPALFEMECKSPRQMMLANAFRRCLEKGPTILRSRQYCISLAAVTHSSSSWHSLGFAPQHYHLELMRWLLEPAINNEVA